MAVAAPKRIYNDDALESWNEKIQIAWEPFFTKQELSLGREIYRNGEIRELEIHEYDAIVHARFDQEACYALIEWSKGKFKIRSSSDDKLLGRALAVAGMYDIEELVAEEGKQLPQAEKKEEKSDKERILEAILKKKRGGKDKEVAAAPEPVKEDSRPLALEFSIVRQGLVFKAVWRNEDGDFVPALKSEDNEGAEANSVERERLIGLASLARKGGFRFNNKRGEYGLGNLEKIRAFFGDDFDEKWSKRYDIKMEIGVERLSRGVQEADIVVDLEGCEAGTLDFCWSMYVGDQVLNGEDARLLIQNTGKPVMLSKMGIVCLAEEKTELLATWKRWLDLYSDGQIPRYVLFSLFGEEPIKLKLSEELKSWKDSLYHISNETMDVPDFLRPYQEQGVKWLWHLCDRNCHGLLADEMGLGKTIQILSLLSGRNLYPDKPNLIICPASVVPVWQQEVERFFPHLRVEVLKSGNDFYKCGSDVLWVGSYAQLRMHKYLLETTEFGYAVLDEAQLIKNPEAKVSQACMRIRAKHRLVLTGTPLENRFLDIWTIFRFLMPGLLGTRRHFESEVSKNPNTIRDRIKKQIAPFVLRRTKSDVLTELPGKTEMDCVCPMTIIQKSEYERLTKDGVKLLGEDIPTAVKEKSLSFLTLLTRLRQVCCDPSLLPWQDAEVEDSGKIIRLIERLEEVFANDHKVVIFSQFVSLLDRVEGAIEKYYPEIPVFQLTGKTIDREKPVRTFQEHEGAGVMLVSLRAGGTGITLHSADYVFLMDPWWNPAVEEQAIDRVHRFGQDKPVFVYRMVTPGTIESRIQSLKNEKKGMFSGVLGGMSDISDVRNYFDSLSELIALLPEDK